MIALFIGDDHTNRRVVRDMLHVAGMEMDDAETGETGLALFEARRCDLLLVDLGMAGISGTEVIRTVRGRPDAKAAVPLIVMTADAAGTTRDLYLAAGADDVLFNPVSMDTLFEAIGRVLAYRKGRDDMVA